MEHSGEPVLPATPLRSFDRLRRLPPPPNLAPESAHLVAELATLPHDADPVTWLRDSHPDLTIRIALTAALRSAFLTMTGMVRARDSGITVPSEDVASVLLRSRDALELLRPLSDETVLPSVEELQSTVDRLRRIAATMSIPGPDRQAPAVDALLRLVISEPEGGSVVGLMSGVGAFSQCAEVAANHLVWEALAPALPDRVGRVLKTRKINRRFSFGPVSIRIDRLSLAERGFLVTTSLAVSSGGVPHHTGVAWSGVESAVDSAGARYALRALRGHSHRGWRGRWRLDHVFSGWPTLCPPLQSLTLHAAGLVEFVDVRGPIEPTAKTRPPRTVVRTIDHGPLELVIEDLRE